METVLCKVDERERREVLSVEEQHAAKISEGEVRKILMHNMSGKVLLLNNFWGYESVCDVLHFWAEILILFVLQMQSFIWKC